MGTVKMKHTTKSYGKKFIKGTISEPTLNEDNEKNLDGVYYYYFENIGTFIYFSDGEETVINQLVVQFISGPEISW